jgi:hypothetical protein
LSFRFNLKFWPKTFHLGLSRTLVLFKPGGLY